MARTRGTAAALAALLALTASACGASKDATSTSSAAAPPASSADSSAPPASAATTDAPEATAPLDSTATSSSATVPASTGKKIKIGLVSDQGGLNDKGFNQLSYEGVLKAKAELGAQVDVKESKSPSDYIPNLTYFAARGYDIVITIGYNTGPALGKVAKQYPKVHFAILDFSVTDPAIGSLPNVLGIQFKEQETGYLVGYLAGALAKRNFTKFAGKNVISSVGGQKIPPVDHYIAGYQAGARAADPAIKLLNGYSGDFVDQSKCKALAQAQIAQGSRVVFQVAGNCGLGVITAAKDKGVWAIGVDADQAYLGAQVLTSSLKRVDQAVFQLAQRVQAGQFSGGKDDVVGLKEQGVGIGKIAAGIPPDVLAAVKEQEAKIVAGQITVPATVGK